MPTGLAIQPWDPRTPNADVIAAIWRNGSTDFQRRVPEPTKANLEASIKAIVNYQPNYNEFASALINKVGRTIARNQSWTNPLAEFKIGMLEFGESIEEYQTGLIKAYVYDPRREYGEKALFGRHGIDVQASYHTINRENMYALTVEHPVLKRAFNTPDGLSQFVSQLMQAPTTSDQWDEFLIMANSLREYERNNGFFKIHVDALTNGDTARAFLEVLREYAEILPYLSDRYNAARMPVHANRDELILFTTPKVKAKLDVQALAALFNVEYGQVPYRVIALPEEHFFGYGEDIQAVLTTKDFFVAADTYFDIASQPNPAGRYENYFLHHDGIYSVSRFVPAIAFTLGEGTIVLDNPTTITGVESITLTDWTGAQVSGNSIVRGGNYMVHGGPVTDPADNADLEATRFTLDGAKSVRSFIENTGELHIAVDDPTSSVTVTQLAVTENDITNSVTLTVTGPIVNYWPDPGVTPDDDNDGVPEVTPVAPTFADNTITIPSVKGVQYLVGGTPANNGSTHEITAETVVTAEARTGYELSADAEASWTFTPTA